MQNLVIVESPTKAKTLSKFLGKGYEIQASMGHIRDLPKSALGVDEVSFDPQYVIPRDKRKRVNELKKDAAKAENIWLATDPDREGEAIAWHIAYLLGDGEKKPMQRVVFHEITQTAIEDAFKHPREIDLKLVDAQQARRVLDRLVGYKLSPVLWEKVKRGLSAGRVQSVALRLIVEREREVQAFVPVEYWSIEAFLQSRENRAAQFYAAVIEHNGKKLEVHSADEAKTHVTNLEKAEYAVSNITQKDVKRSPAAPFTTSTLQQTAGNRLGFSAKKTMMLAQNLYEQGYITYMRTDSVTLSSQALGMAREYIEQNYDAPYAPPAPRQYKSRVKNAQEAHESIRPTSFKTQATDLEGQYITRDHRRLYELIWKRTLASQMSDAQIVQTTIDVKATHSDQEYKLRATGSVIKFDGWLTLYGVKTMSEEKKAEAEGEAQEDEKEQILPQLKADEPLNLIELKPGQHFTQPPPRYTESSLVKKLEELGIGRPSTYAPILSTIQERFYVEKTEKKFVPTTLGTTVNDFLMQHFPETFDYKFTADMEESLDEVSRGEKQWKEILAQVYKPLEAKIGVTKETAEKVQLEQEVSDKMCPECGKQLLVRTGRFGKFLACSGFPDCKHTEAIEQIVEAKCPDDGGDIVVRRTKKGKIFYGCKNYPKCKYATWNKPKAAADS